MMNDSTVSINESLLPQAAYHPYWMLGFSEADCSFTIQTNKNFSPRYAITQNEKSLIVLHGIQNFINKLPFQIPNGISLTSVALLSATLKSKNLLLQAKKRPTPFPSPALFSSNITNITNITNISNISNITNISKIRIG
jgi:hypothetical protein